MKASIDATATPQNETYKYCVPYTAYAHTADVLEKQYWGTEKHNDLSNNFEIRTECSKRDNQI